MIEIEVEKKDECNEHKLCDDGNSLAKDLPDVHAERK